MGTYQKTSSGRVLIEAGRVDATDATVPRFPASQVAEVRRKAQELFNQEKPLAVVCSAACGADLIVLDVAESMGVERHVLLPSKPAEFRRSSVVDRPGDWGEIYDRVLKTSRVKVLKLPEGQQGYLETNLRPGSRSSIGSQAFRIRGSLDRLEQEDARPRRCHCPLSSAGETTQDSGD